MRKLAFRAAAALVMLGLAAPALPCGDAKTTMAGKDTPPAASKDTSREAVASKAPAQKKATTSKAKAQSTQTTTAAN